MPLAGGTFTGGIGFSTTNTLDIGTNATTLAPRTIYAGTSFVGPVGTFTTSMSAPITIGGAAASSSLTLESTSGTGTSDSIVFKTGSQSTRWQIDTSGHWAGGANTSNPNDKTMYVAIPNSDSGTDGIEVRSANNKWYFLSTGMGAGSLNNIVQAGDSGIIFSNNASDTGNFVIAPWATGAGGMRINNVGNASFPATTVSTSKTTGNIVNLGGFGNAGAIFTDTLNVITMAADTAQTDATVCRVAATGLLYTGTGALGICLGTSGRQFKTAFAPMVAGIDDLMKIDFVNYRYLDGYGDNGAHKQYGTTAQNVEAVLPDIARHDVKGETINYDSGALLFIGLHAIQQLKADNDNMRAEINELKRATR
jgi:hypothetical protein